MKTPAYTEAAAIEASRHTLLPPGWVDGAISAKRSSVPQLAATT